MNKQTHSSLGIDMQSAASLRPARSRRWVMAGVAAAMVSAMSVAGISYADNAPGQNQGQMQPHHGMHGQKDPANAEKRIDRMVQRLLPDGTPEQKAKVTAIARSAMNDLRPLREQQRAARVQGIKLLTQPTIDRAALERVRATQMQLAEQISSRTTRALADAADVLTPAQRAKAAEHFQKRMEHGHMGHNR
jgi:protein CpxP